MDTVYRQVRRVMRAKNLPIPQQGQLNRGGDIALVRNRAARRGAQVNQNAAMPPAAPAPPPVQSRMTAPQRQVTPPRTEPPQHVPWRALVRPEAQPVVVHAPKSWWQRLMTVLKSAQLVWVACALVGAYVGGLDAWWMSLALVCGLLPSVRFLHLNFMMRAGAFEAMTFRMRATLNSVVVAAPTLVIYLLATLSRSMVVWASVCLASYFLKSALLVFFQLTYERNRFAADARTFVEGLRDTRFILPGGNPDLRMQMLVEPLLVIPSLRLTGPADSGYADRPRRADDPGIWHAVAGRQVLVFLVMDLPPGLYTKTGGTRFEVRRNGEPSAAIDARFRDVVLPVAERIAQLKRRVSASVSGVVIVQTLGSRGGAADLAFGDIEGVRFVHAPDFVDFAGDFLVQGQDTLDGAVLVGVAAALADLA
jgi:hypothetical protein